MTETKVLVDEETIDYEGLFNPPEIYDMIDEFLSLKGYEKIEALNEEQVLEEGKDIHMVLTPIKWHTDYVRKAMKLDIRMRDVREVETKIDKVKVKMCQGKIQILFSGMIHTDWEGRWENRPIYYLMKTMFEKYVYKSHQDAFEAEVVSDVKELKKNIGAYSKIFSNIQRWKYGKLTQLKKFWITYNFQIKQ